MKHKIKMMLLCLLCCMAGKAQEADTEQLPTAAEYLQQTISDWKAGKATGQYLVLSRAAEACGLLDTLSKVKDELYERMYLQGEIPDVQGHPTFNNHSPGYVPAHRYYGFTLFAETDAYWQSQGLDPKAADLLPKLQQWVKSHGQYATGDSFTEDANYKSPNNLLYQWLTYHILPMRLPIDKLVIHYNEKGYYYPRNPSGSYGIPVMEYYTTMGARRLLKIYEGGQNAPEGIFLNRFPRLDNGFEGTYTETGCDADKAGVQVGREDVQNLQNACVYPLSQPLAFTDGVRDCLGSERIRFDVTSIFPEFMNNGIRASREWTERSLCVGIPENWVYQYCDGLNVGGGSRVYYLSGFKMGWLNFQGDEIDVTGQMDLTIQLPPVPKTGVYELRMAKRNLSANCTMADFYLGTDRDNLPMLCQTQDLRIGGSTGTEETNPIGWSYDMTGNERNNRLVDLQLRAHNHMKGPEACAVTGEFTMRQERALTRLVLCRQRFEAGKTYYLRIKDALGFYDKELYLDYFEFCPESVYDNPDAPEDIW